jgi:opacity protein-like surface antigen
MRSLSLLLLSAACSFAQPFSFGVRGGVPLTDFVSTVESGTFNYHSKPDRYIIGVGAELHLPFGFAVGVDALYRHLNYAANSGTTGVTTVISSSTTGNAWEFPLLAKYRFSSGVVRPLVEAGVAWDTLQGLKQTITRTVSGTTTRTSSSSPAELNRTTTTGFVIGAGLDVKAVFIHIQPEIRYTRWGTKHFFDTNGLLSSNQNQAEFLLGISF